MVAKWFMTDFDEWACHEAYHIQTDSDVPVHQWLRWTLNPPWKHPTARMFRGLRVMGDVYYCFTGHISIEQNEPGDTLIHTFDVFPWPRYEIRYFYMIGFINRERSPSHSPIFARSIDYVFLYHAARITHAADVAVIFHNEVFSFPPSTPAFLTLGRLGLPTHVQGGALRFRNSYLPRCAELLTAHLTVNAAFNYSADPVNARLSVENVDNAFDFDSITTAAFWLRYARRAGIVDHDNIPHWSFGLWYDTPSLITPLNILLSRPGWRAGNAVVLFYEDFDQRTPPPANRVRVMRTYSPPLPFEPVLQVWYNHWQVIGEAIY